MFFIEPIVSIASQYTSADRAGTALMILVANTAVPYTARDEFGAFIESFGQPGSIGVTTTALTQCGLATLASQRPLNLIDLCSPGSLARIGADSRLFAAERGVAQLWARAFYEHSYAPDGILYPARHDNNRAAVAVFDRAPIISVVNSYHWHDGGALRPLL